MKLKKIIFPLLVLALLGGGGFAFVQYEKQKHLSSAEYALEEIRLALAGKDVESFKRHVHTHKVSLSILKGMLQDAPQDESATGPGESSSNLFEDVGSKLAAKLGRRVASFVQPELSKNLQAQMLTFVQNGDFGDEVDLSRLYGGATPMLESLWHEFKGEGVTFAAFENIQEAEYAATADLPYTRADLSYDGKVSFTLEKTEAGVWQIVSIDNLAEELVKLKEKEHALFLEKNKQIQAEMQNTLQVVNVEKSAGVSQWGVGKGLLIRAGFENIGERTISAFHATLIFKDENGDVIKETSISDTDTLLASTVVEKSWPMGINPLSASDKYIYAAEGASLTIDVAIESIRFEDGAELKLIEME